MKILISGEGKKHYKSQRKKDQIYIKNMKRSAKWAPLGNKEKEENS